MEFDTGPEALLEHQDFVRGLARSLLADPGAADDAAQEAWLSAVKAPPRHAGNPRGWLAAAVRSAARMHWRAEGRRRAREGAAAKPEATISTAEVVEREMLRRDVVEAVLALDEPYRSAVLWRFYRDTPPREIATLRGIPVETVKSHIKRGLARLRDALASRHGGDAAKLGAVLAVVAGLSTDAVAGVTGATVGGAAMAGSKKLFAAAAVLALVAIPVGLHLGGAFEPEGGAGDSAPLAALDGAVAGGDESSAAGNPSAQAGAGAGAADGAVDGAPPLGPAAPAVAEAPPAARSGTLMVTVRGVDGAPGEGAIVTVTTVARAEEAGLEVTGVVAGADGTAFAGPEMAPPGERVVVFAFRGPDEARLDPVTIPPAGGRPLALTIQLQDVSRPDRGKGAFMGRAYVDGEPLRNASLRFVGNFFYSTGRARKYFSLETDGAGRWGWRNAAPGKYGGILTTDGVAPLLVVLAVEPNSAVRRDLHFTAGVKLRGPLLLPDGESADGARVMAEGSRGRLEGEIVRAGGRPWYRVRGLPPGEHTLRVSLAGYGSAVATVFAPESGELKGPPLVIGLGATITGRLVDPNGVEIVGQEVFVGAPEDYSTSLGGHRSADDGSFRIAGLPRGTYELVAMLGDEWSGTYVRAGEIVIGGDDIDLGDVVVRDGVDSLPDGRLRVRVVRDGAPVAGASLEVTRGYAVQTVVADDAGMADIAPLPRSAVTVVARAGGSVASSTVQIRGRSTQELTLTLGPGGVLRGSLDPQVTDVGSLRVWRSRPGRALPLEQAKSLGQELAARGGGAWELKAMPPGQYRFSVRSADGVHYVRRTVSVAAGQEQWVDLPLAQHVATLRLQVPQAPHKLRGTVRWSRGGGLSGSASITRLDAGGVVIEGLPAGEVRLQLRSDDDAGVSELTKLVTVEAGEGAPIQIEWPRIKVPGGITGSYTVSAEGAPRVRHRIAGAIARRGDLTVEGRVDEKQKRFVFPPLEAGFWTVAVYFGDKTEALKHGRQVDVPAEKVVDVELEAHVPE